MALFAEYVKMFRHHTKWACKQAFRVSALGIAGAMFSVCDNTISSVAIVNAIHMDAVDVNHVGV